MFDKSARLTLVAFVLAFAGLTAAENVDLKTDLFRGLQWRNIGPERGGRSLGCFGQPRPAARVLLRRDRRRALEDDRRRRELESRSPTARSRAPRSAPSRWRRRTPTSSTLAAVRLSSAGASPRATGSTSRPTAARPGATSAFATRRRSPASASTRRTPTSSTSPRSATPTARTKSAVSSAPPTAATPGRRCSTRRRGRGPPTSSSTGRTRA